MKYYWLTLLTISLISSGCNVSTSSEDSSELERYQLIPIENSVILEADSSLTLLQLVASLHEYSAAHINTLCVERSSFDSRDLHVLVDSCHQAGLNCILYSNQPDELTANMVIDLDIDGFRCVNVQSKSVDYWQKKIDSLNDIKSVIMISDYASDELKNAGFAAGHGYNVVEALKKIFTQNESTALLDTALKSEQFIFSKTFTPVRYAPRVFSTDSAAQEAGLLAAFAMTGVPYITAAQRMNYHAFFQSYLTLYANTPTLQYGSTVLYDSGSEDVLMIVREFQGRKIIFVINTRSHASSYNWPLNLMGIKTELLLGEKISRNGGQELPPYGYQVLKFENIIGMEAMELDET